MSSVEKTFLLLNKLRTAPYEFTLGELAEAANCGKSGAYKLLSVMVKENYVQQLNDKKYALGCRVLDLYFAYDHHFLHWATCQPLLEELRDLTGETITLARWQNGFAHILYRVKSLENLRIEGNVGKQLPVNASAHGKLLAAYQDIQTIEALLEKYPLQKVCPNTITDFSVLKEEYATIRRRGYAISIEESTLGAAGIAAPVFGLDGNVCASLCCGTPLIRLTPEKQAFIIEQTATYAQKLSRLVSSQSPTDC